MKRTQALLEVAMAMLDEPTARQWGYDLSKRTGLRSGALYPLLHRMLDEGWLEDGWEEFSASQDKKRPPRRYYELTDAGIEELGGVVAAAQARERNRPARGRAIPRPA